MWKKKPYNKYGAKKVFQDGVKFDSKLEMYCYNQLNTHDIPFEFQVKINLMPKFKDVNGKAIREMNLICDFILSLKERTLFVDTKGFFTADAKLKYKLLKYKIYLDGNLGEIIFLRNKKEVDNFIKEYGEARWT
jgi:hypothetical protein